jgi:hypothetical protein
MFVVAPLFGDPIVDVGRAVEERDASCFTGPKEANNLQIDQVHFRQIHRKVRPALPDLLLQFPQVFPPHPPNQSNDRAAPTGVPFDLQGHACAACNPSAISN